MRALLAFAERSACPPGSGGGSARLREVRKQQTLPLFPGNITATPLPKMEVLSLGGCPTTSPRWPCVSLLPLGNVWLSSM